MSGFSLSIAAHVLRYGIRSRTAQLVFLLFLLSSLLFLLALYVDVRLSIELAGVDSLPEKLLNSVTKARNVGTTSATFALIIFIIATGLLGWLATPLTGFISTLLAAGVFYRIWSRGRRGASCTSAAFLRYLAIQATHGDTDDSPLVHVVHRKQQSEGLIFDLGAGSGDRAVA